MNIGKGKGKNKGGAFGPGGYCVCPKCGEKAKRDVEENFKESP